MKEDKKTVHKNKNNTAKKNNTSNKKPNTPTKKNNINNNRASDAPRVTKIESPVKETKKVDIDEDFIEEDNDKKLIVVIAIAVLVILITIIGLLVGCERKEDPKPQTPADDEIIVPVQVEDDKEDEVVVKVSTKKSDDEEETDETVVPSYDVIYYYNNNQRTHHESADEGTTAKEYVPEGYNSCKYYIDENYTNEYPFDNVFEDVNIYLDCEAINYTVVYNFDETIATNNENNPTTFTVEDELNLEDVVTDLIFVGWYADSAYTKEVTVLDRNLVKYAEGTNVNLYAKIVSEVTVELFDSSNNNIYNKTFTANESYTLPAAEHVGACSTEGQKFLGWATTKGSKNVEYKDAAELELNRNYNLYAVCGDATIVYVSNGETVTVGYTNEELLEEGFELPAPSDMGMETPVYFVPVDEETLTSKKVVSDDEVELKDNEVYFSQVVDNAIEGYTPNIGDSVEGFEKEFLGWVEKTEDTTSEETTPEETTPETEETDFVTTEEVVEEITNSTEEEVEVELEAVWGIPEQETETTPEVEPTPETPEVEETPEVPEVEELPVA